MSRVKNIAKYNELITKIGLVYFIYDTMSLFGIAYCSVPQNLE